MISPILNALGLMKRSEHEREIEILKDILEETRAAELLYLNKFKQAVSDLEEIAYERDELRHDANMWRNSLKRSRDRKKVTK